MKKLTKAHAARLMGLSRYRLDKEIARGAIVINASGSVCVDSLSRSHPEVAAALHREWQGATAAFTEEQASISSPSLGIREPEPRERRLIGKLESLLSLAEKHRLMIEQQRRNIGLLKAINQRQQRELERLRQPTAQPTSQSEKPWRRLFTRFARA